MVPDTAGAGAVPLLPGSIHGHPAVLHAQEQPATSQNSRNQPPSGPRRWTFDEKDEEAPTWADDLRAQALDIALVVAFSGSRSSASSARACALKYVTLIAAVAFLGF